MSSTLYPGSAEEIREAKLYFSAFKKAEEAGGLVIDVRGPGSAETYYEEDISNAERWKIGDDFIAAHRDDKDSKAEPASALRSPPPSDPFWANMSTEPGDAEKTYIRLMTEQFPVEADD
jgi:hypothetical protein